MQFLYKILLVFDFALANIVGKFLNEISLERQFLK